MKESLPDAAKGKPCTFRVPGTCNNDWETSVLCHLRDANIAGIAQKPNDLIAAIGCHACHDWIDARVMREGELNKMWIIDPAVDTAKLQAMVRTLDYWHENGQLTHNRAGELRWEAHHG